VTSTRYDRMTDRERRARYGIGGMTPLPEPAWRKNLCERFADLNDAVLKLMRAGVPVDRGAGLRILRLRDAALLRSEYALSGRRYGRQVSGRPRP